MLSALIASSLFGRGLAVADSCAEEAPSAVAFLQTKIELPERVALVQEPGSSVLVGSAAEKINAMMTQMKKKWDEEAFWGSGLEIPSKVPGCGTATARELQMNIPTWQRLNPGQRGFCHFNNFGFWFPAIPVDDYTSYATESQSVSADIPNPTGGVCQSFGAVDGPEVSIAWDGLNFTWTHARDCIDVVDDPYCYSMGWLKGQNLDGALMNNKTAWHLLAKSECQKIQDEFQFVDEELTVGRHVESTPIYFQRTWCALSGECPAVTRRIHKEHTMSKCQLGAESGEYAASEMAYCYYKACVLPGNRVGHSHECK